MTAAFGLLIMGGVVLMAGIRNRSVGEILQGITEPLATDGGSMRGVSLMSSFDVGSAASGLSTVDGKPVCSWIAAELRKAKRRGWSGTVTSGYRSEADQARVCSETSGPCAAPGESNHQGKRYPGCAIDVSDPAGLAAALPAGSPLKWTGRSIGDDVHFSSGLQGV